MKSAEVQRVIDYLKLLKLPVNKTVTVSYVRSNYEKLSMDADEKTREQLKIAYEYLLKHKDAVESYIKSGETFLNNNSNTMPSKSIEFEKQKSYVTQKEELDKKNEEDKEKTKELSENIVYRNMMMNNLFFEFEKLDRSKYDDFDYNIMGEEVRSIMKEVNSKNNITKEQVDHIYVQALQNLRNVKTKDEKNPKKQSSKKMWVGIGIFIIACIIIGLLIAVTYGK